MDDFEFAAQRLSKDQSKYGRRTNGTTNSSRLVRTGGVGGSRTTNGRGGGIVLSEKAKREAEERKQQQKHLAQEKLRQKQQSSQQKQFFKSMEQTLGVQQLTRTGLPLQLQATSIYGEGDKIALPPSVLEFITNEIDTDGMNGLSPWFFRIAIPNPNYTFPASPLLQSYEKSEDDSMNDDDEDDEDKKESEQVKLKRQIYLDELRYKYLSYTHGTVVEFTQDEGCVGLPKPICDALLGVNTTNSSNNTTNQQSDVSTNPKSTTTIPITRTVDPALVNKSSKNDDNDAEVVDDDDNNNNSGMEIEESGTPGHVAYNAFDIPALPIEITLIRNIPKGKSCTLIPDITALQNGFYQLPDIKLVLEQSLIRTRATLSVNDTIQTWHRGKQYTLHVKDVAPCDTYTAISCINTDIEIEFGQVPNVPTESTTSNVQNTTALSKTENKSFFPSSGGYTLGGSSSNSESTKLIPATTIPTTQTSTSTNLLQEPPAEQKENIVTIQIRGSGLPSNLRRRFNITVATVNDLYHFVTISSSNLTNFQLVTRFPRRIISLEEKTQSQTLAEAGMQTGNELLLIEPL